MATRTTTAGLAAVAAALDDLAGEALGLASRIHDLAATRLDVDRPRTKADLAPVGELVLPALATPGALVQGAGLVLEHRVLADADWWLEWFAVGSDGRPQRLSVQTDPGGVSSYEYEHLPWFAVPRETGRRHLTGPYVDYLCTEDYTLTFTEPVLVDGAFLGVAGADVSVAELERRLLPTLRSTEERVAVVNTHGRILASNRGRDICGELIDDVAALTSTWEEADPAALVRISDIPLAVVALDRLAG